MIGLNERMTHFLRLGEILRGYTGTESDPALLSLHKAVDLSSLKNPWFTKENIHLALKNLGRMLGKAEMERWLSSYPEIQNKESSAKVAVIMAGNIPLVGFHDFLCVLMSGNRISARLSSDDALLLPAVTDILKTIHPDWAEVTDFTTGTVQGFDAVIATGSNNTSRYFDYYFGKYPHIIRKNRNSVAILSGMESQEDLAGLAHDLLDFFGLGCRNVSKLFLPDGYDFSGLINALAPYDWLSDHHKYRNNFDYQRSMHMLNQVPAIDAGSILMVENRSVASPISVVHYEFYDDLSRVISNIQSQATDIQCVVTNMPMEIPTVLPGEAQRPALWDYSDGIDTMKFLVDLQ